MYNTLVQFLKESLNETDYRRLQELNQVKFAELRQRSLRDFFHQPEIFNLIDKSYDPSWVSYDIFINGAKYEF